MILKFVFVVGVLKLASAQVATHSPSCDNGGGSNMTCGVAASGRVGARDCADLGCCMVIPTCPYGPYMPCDRTPRCVLPKDLANKTDCVMKDEDKESCGDPGMDWAACLGQKCCWHPTSDGKAPWCYRTKTDTSYGRNTSFYPSGRRDGDLEVEKYSYYDYKSIEGRLKIYHDGQWGTICRYNFDINAAMVACRNLGYDTGHALANSTHSDPSRTTMNSGRYKPDLPIWLGHLNCTGNEQNLTDCPHARWGDTHCSHNDDVIIKCFRSKSASYGSGNEGGLRLMDGPTSQEGRLEIYHDGEWGSVCDHGFTALSAKVVCMQLGHNNGAIVRKGAFYGMGTGRLWLDMLDCKGSESSLKSCSNGGWGNHDCSHADDVGVYCGSAPSRRKKVSPSSKYRLYGGPRHKGRFQAYDVTDRMWKDVCHYSSYEGYTARAICKNLGFTGSSTYRRVSVPSHTEWYPYYLYCTSNYYSTMRKHSLSTTEILIDSAKQLYKKVGQCSYNHSLDITCIPNKNTHDFKEGDIDLMSDTSDAMSGILAVFHAGKWGTVCNDGFTADAATVACRKMGLGRGYIMTNDHTNQTDLWGSIGWLERTSPIWMDEVRCSGSELSLEECRHAGWGFTDCARDEDVAIKCDTPQDLTTTTAFVNTTNDGCPVRSLCEGKLRLANRLGSEAYGLLEIYHHGEWGTVCSQNFTNNNIDVACRQLGYDYGELLTWDTFQTGQDEQRVWIGPLMCVGVENKLKDCAHYGWGATPCNHEQDVGIRCKKGTQGNTWGNTYAYSSSVSYVKPYRKQNYIYGSKDCAPGAYGRNCDKYRKDCAELYKKTHKTGDVIAFIKPSRTYKRFHHNVICNKKSMYIIYKPNSKNQEFNRSWAETKDDWSCHAHNLNATWWSGLESLYWLTHNNKACRVTVNLRWSDGSHLNETYTNFRVKSETSNYKVEYKFHKQRLNNFGAGTTSLPAVIPNGVDFSTFDKGHHRRVASMNGGGWWYPSGRNSKITLPFPYPENNYTPNLIRLINSKIAIYC